VTVNSPKITASIVLYNEDIIVLTKTINCFLSIPENKILYLIDNTPGSIYKEKFTNEEIRYIESKKNIGFGSGHNLVMPFIDGISDLHLILNPDIFFTSKVINILANKLETDNSLAMISPGVKYPDYKNQSSVRRYPNIVDLFSRKFGVFKKRNLYQEYRDKDLTKPFYPEAIHGCFMFFKTADFIKIKGFDERYFLYMEDIDICKKIDMIGKRKMYYPEVHIIHLYRKQSSKELKAFTFHVNSAIKYFLKWGITRNVNK